jgi:hypothetical protein
VQKKITTWELVVCGVEKAPKSVRNLIFSHLWLAKCSGGAQVGMGAVGALLGVPKDSVNM